VIIEAGCDLPAHADASITDKSGTALAIKTADCVPLLLVCTKTKMIAAVHAGWQGALNRIAAKTVKKMIDKGAKPSRIVAALGPSLHQESFQIQEDVRDKFRDAQPETIGFFKTFGDRWLLDMSGIVAHQLAQEGVTKIGHSPTNTYTSPNHYSFRRRHDDPANETGRNVSVIMLV
jgi:YfiH family protein